MILSIWKVCRKFLVTIEAFQSLSKEQKLKGNNSSLTFSFTMIQGTLINTSKWQICKAEFMVSKSFSNDLNSLINSSCYKPLFEHILGELTVGKLIPFSFKYLTKFASNLITFGNLFRIFSIFSVINSTNSITTV